MTSIRYDIIPIGHRCEPPIDLNSASEMSGMHPEMILEFVRAEFVHAVRPVPGSLPRFDRHDVMRLRQIEHLRSAEHSRLRTIRYILHLLDELEDARRQLRSVRKQRQ